MTPQLQDQGISPLLNCPMDVFDLILKSLSPAVRARLCLVNKSLQESVEPNLYASVQWNWLSDHQPTSIVLFVRSVLQRPQLGGHVRSLALMGVPPARSREPDKVPISILQNESYPTTVVDDLLKTQVISGKTWIELLHAGSMDALVALLIAHLPNLTSLHLGPRFTRDNACLGLLLRSALCEPVVPNLPKFEHLRTVNFNTGRFSHSGRLVLQQNTPHVLSFFYLPSIEHLHTSFDGPGDFTWPAPGDQVPVSHNLTELDLGCPIRAAHLGKVLSVTPRLRSLRWDWYHGGVTTPFGNDGAVDLDQIAAGLSLVRETLTELVITARCTVGANKQFPQSSSKGSLKLLVDFPAIKKIQAPIAFLMGWSRNTSLWGMADVVPRTTESLSIMDNLWYHHNTYVWNDQVMLDVVKAWLAQPERLPPNLRFFQVLLKDSHKLELGSVIEELVALGSHVGIEVDVSMQRRTCSLKWSHPAH